LTPQEWRPRTREADAELETTGRVRPYTKEYFDRDGRRLRGLFGGAQLTGRPDGVAFMVDVTELRHAQERALQAERVAAIGEAMTGLIHEGRNALQRGHACLEMLALHVQDRPEALGLITRVQAAQDQLHRLYEDIRGHAAPIRLTCRDCALSAAWHEAWAGLAHVRCGRTATLREEIGGSAMRVNGDPFHLGIVFRNLLENALAAASDLVEIVVQAGPSELEDHPAVRGAVRDNGPGLDAEQSRRAFDPFYTTKAKGTGLGLAIARRIVVLHGGRIAIGESRRAGSEIQITLPVSGPRVGQSELR